MPNAKDPNFNKNVSMVYVEEAGFTGYKGFDFTKIDDIENILRAGVAITGSVKVTNLSGSFDSATANSYLSGILSETTNIDNKLFVTGDPSPAGVQGTIVFQADLTQQFDAVTNFPEQSSGINNFNADTSNGTVLNENIYRRELFIQNLATGVLYVKYGAQANISNFNFILAANTSTNAGDGGSLSDQGYNGVVSVSGINGINSPRYIAWERTNINKTPLI